MTQLDDTGEALAAAVDSTRRAVLAFVARSPAPVGRDAAAAAVGVPRATAAFHLDRLVEAGLLASTFSRVNGRTGPGAGRPAKLYQRTDLEVGVSLPERRYDLAGDLLSAAIEVATDGDWPMDVAIADVARQRGREIGARVGSLDGALETMGYEPRDEHGTVLLLNCPFHRLATRHTRTICALNLALTQGLAEGVGEDPERVCFAPADGRCCVEIRRTGGDAQPPTTDAV